MEKVAFDPVRFKEQERNGFNFVADRYEAAMTIASPAVERLLTLAELEVGQDVLDVATGPGIIARQVAHLVGPGGRVVGIDLAENALEKARAQATAENLTQVTFEVADAEALGFEDHRFDRVFCAMALMHFPQPEKALLEFRRVLKPKGKLLASVWSEEAPFISVALATLTRNFPPPKVERPSMFRFGKAAVLAKLVQEAGFQQIEVESVTLRISFPDPASYWRNFLDIAGITTVVLTKQPPEVREHLEKDVALDLAPYHKNSGGYDLESRIMIVSAKIM